MIDGEAAKLRNLGDRCVCSLPDPVTQSHYESFFHELRKIASVNRCFNDRRKKLEGCIKIG